MTLSSRVFCFGSGASFPDERAFPSLAKWRSPPEYFASDPKGSEASFPDESVPLIRARSLAAREPRNRGSASASGAEANPAGIERLRLEALTRVHSPAQDARYPECFASNPKHHFHMWRCLGRGPYPDDSFQDGAPDRRAVLRVASRFSPPGRAYAACLFRRACGLFFSRQPESDAEGFAGIRRSS